MADQHGRYEQLAVGHVLGGLGTADAAEFRSHLIACPSCRTRVAELRDIAADLEAAERDERARAQVRTELPRRTDPDHLDGPGSGRITIRHVTIAAVTVLVLAGAMAFWNLHLRTVVAAQSTLAEAHADTLRELASGVPVDADFGEGVTGMVVADDDRVAISLAGVDDVGPDESLVAWLLDAGGTATADSALLARPGQLDDGLVAAVVDIGEADELVVTRETGQLGQTPTGDVLARASFGPRPGRDP